MVVKNNKKTASKNVNKSSSDNFINKEDNQNSVKAMRYLVWTVGILLIIVLLMNIYSFFNPRFRGPIYRRPRAEFDRPCPYRDDIGPIGGKPRLRRDDVGPKADEMRGPRRDGTGPRAEGMRGPRRDGTGPRARDRRPEPREDVEKKADKKD